MMSYKGRRKDFFWEDDKGFWGQRDMSYREQQLIPVTGALVEVRFIFLFAR